MHTRRTLMLIAVATASFAAVAARQPKPVFTVDPLWPKPLKNPWVIGSVTGLAVDQRDHVWVAHRAASLNTRTEAGLLTDPPSAEYCCAAAPPVLEFDQSGALVAHWGGPGQGYVWPDSPGGLVVDDKDNVWITAAGAPEPAAPAAGATGVVGGGRGRGAAAGPPPVLDTHVLKFSRTGQFVLQIGQPKQPGSRDSQDLLNQPADIAVDTAANEVYVADGGTSQRVAVFDATTGAFKRQWTGHGSDFARLSAIALSKDGLVYVGDRKNNRIQTFKKDGTFVKETLVSPKTLGNGSVWDVALSTDPQQRFVLVADGQNAQVIVLQRDSMQEVTTIGDGGRWPGRFYAVNSVAMDSKGIVYTGEGYEGKRVQRFLRK